MLNDTLVGLDDEDLEDVANTEVEKILSEVLASHGPLPVAPDPVSYSVTEYSNTVTTSWIIEWF